MDTRRIDDDDDDDDDDDKPPLLLRTATGANAETVVVVVVVDDKEEVESAKAAMVAMENFIVVFVCSILFLGIVDVSIIYMLRKCQIDVIAGKNK